MSTSKLTAKQQRFVEEYLVDLNATQAAIRAGYAPKAAKVTACRMLTRANVAAAIVKHQKRPREKTELNEAWVLRNLQEIAERCMQHRPVLDRKGNPVVVETPDGELAPAYTFDPAGANRAVELVGKHFAMFTDRLQVDELRDLSDEEVDARIEQTRREAGIPTVTH